MKRICFSLVALLMGCISLNAQQRSESEAIQIAQEFFGKKGKTPQLSVVPNQKVEAKVRKNVAGAKNAAPIKNQSFYVLNDEANNRFVIVSADERMYTILGYSDNGVFDVDSVPEGLLEIAAGYNQAYEFLLSQNEPLNIHARASRKVVEPMVKTQWHQVYPYNAECPIDPRYEQYADNDGFAFGISIRGATGCVATAMAQVMTYHKYPACGHGAISYNTRSLNIPQSMDFSTMPFDWDNMAETYVDENYSDIQKDAVARLMHVCGNSVIMDYTLGSSGAQNPNLAYALIHYFDYNPNIRTYAKNYFSSTEWEDIIHTDLENGRPIIYTGQGQNGGHAFVLDGCDAEGKYHINWGYNGMYDGYFELTALDIDDSNYNLDQEMICNITPQQIGEGEDMFFAESYAQGDGVANNMVGSRTSAQITNIYCYSVNANTYDTKFDGEVGIGLFDANRNFIKSLTKADTYMNAYTGWSNKSFYFTYDRATFSEGMKFNIAPYAKAKNSSKPTFIRTTYGVKDAYNVEVKDGQILVRLGWLDVPVTPTSIILGNYKASAFNFSSTREDWDVQLSQLEGNDTIWFSNIDPIGYKGSTVYGIVENDGSQIRIPTTQALSENRSLYNYSSTGDIIVYVSSQDSTMLISDTWGIVEHGTTGDNATQKELTKYSSTILRYSPVTLDVVEVPVILVKDRKMTITCATKDAEIRYSIGGTNPDKNSLLYNGVVSLTDNRTVKAIAYKGESHSEIVEKSDINDFTVSKPEFVPNGNIIEVHTSDPVDATIYYTLDGSKPTKNSKKYSDPIICDGSTVITAFATKDYWNDSEINEYTYTSTPSPDIKPDSIYDVVIENLEAGQLASKILPADAGSVRALWLSGELNGTDIKLIREMATTGNLTDLNIQNVKIVSGGDSYYMTSYNSYTTSDGVIGQYMFYRCKNLITLILPDKLTLIEEHAFDGCENLNSLAIPSNCEEIKMMAIYNCKILTAVSLPANIAKLDDTNFSLCPKLQAINVDRNNNSFKSENGILYDKDGLTLLRYPIGKSETAFVIPDGITTIGSYAFYHSTLESVIIPSSTTSIESTAFGYCKNLSKIDIPNSVTKIGIMAFENCSKLSSVNISDNVAEIKMLTFAYCTCLQSFNFGKNVVSIDGSAFSGCTSLKEFVVDDENPQFISTEGVLYSKDGKTLQKCPMALYRTSYVVPEGIETIAENAFQGCKNIENFILPESIVTIESSAFKGCSMSTIHLPNSVTSIGMMAFEDCDELETFIVPENIKEISMMMLYGCDKLSYLYLPTKINHIDLSAFSYCKNLTTIYSEIVDISAIEFEKSYDGHVNAFDNISDECMWNVPEGCTNEYKTQDWWMDTWKITTHPTNGISTISNEAFGMSWKEGKLIISANLSGIINIYSLNGLLVRSVKVENGGYYQIDLPRGVYVINNKKIVLK